MANEPKSKRVGEEIIGITLEPVLTKQMSQEEHPFISTQIQGRVEDYKHKVEVSTDLSQFILAAPKPRPRATTKAKMKAKPQRVANKKDRIHTISSHVRNRFKFNNCSTQRRTLVEMLAKTDENKRKNQNTAPGQLHDSQTWSRRRVRLIPPANQTLDSVVCVLNDKDETRGMWGQSSGTPSDLGDTDLEMLYDYAEHRSKNITLCDGDSSYSGYTQTLSQILNDDYDDNDNDDNEEIHRTTRPNERHPHFIANSSDEEEVLTCEIENSSGEEELLCI